MVVTTGVDGEAGIGQRQIVKMVMDDVVPIGMLKEFRNVKALPYFWYDGAIFFIAPRANGMQGAAGLRIRCCKQGDIMAARLPTPRLKGRPRFPMDRNAAAVYAMQWVRALRCRMEDPFFNRFSLITSALISRRHRASAMSSAKAARQE